MQHLEAWSEYHRTGDWNMADSETQLATSATPLLDVTFHYPSMQTVRHSPLALLRALPTADVQCAVLQPTTRIRREDTPAWTRVFEKMLCLRELVLDRWCKRYISNVLAHRMPSILAAGDDTRQGTVCMPDLHPLRLMDISVALDTDRPVDPDTFIAKLQASLEVRRTLLRRKLARLEIAACTCVEPVADTEMLAQSVDQTTFEDCDGLYAWDDDNVYDN